MPDDVLDGAVARLLFDSPGVPNVHSIDKRGDNIAKIIIHSIAKNGETLQKTSLIVVVVVPIAGPAAEHNAPMRAAHRKAQHHGLLGAARRRGLLRQA